MPSLKEWITEDGERVLYELTNLLKYLGVELGNMKSLRRTVDANAEKAKATKRPVVDSLELFEEIDMPKYPAIMSIEVETCYNKWITIDRGYIKIMDRPTHRIDWNNDDEIEAHVRGFDRLDGEDYYKSYEESYIVDLIAAMIKDLHI